MSQPTTKDSSPKPTASPSKKGAMAWLRELFAKLSAFIRDVATKAIELVKRSPLTIAAGAAIAMLFLV